MRHHGGPPLEPFIERIRWARDTGPMGAYWSYGRLAMDERRAAEMGKLAKHRDEARC